MISTGGSVIASAYGSIFAMGSAAILALIPAAEPGEAGLEVVDKYGIVGLLFILAGALWLRMEKQDKEAKEYRDRREGLDREQTERLAGALAKNAQALEQVLKALDKLERGK